MAGATQGANNAGIVPPQQRVQKTASLFDAFNEVVRHLAESLQEALKFVGLNRKSNTQNTPQPAGAAAGGAAAGGAAARGAAARGAAARGAAAGAAAPRPAPFDTKKWLTDQCVLLAGALEVKTPEGKQNLQELYNSARSLKTSLLDNARNIRTSLPRGLRRDFAANVEIIRAYFDSADNTNTMSQHEICFLHAYVNFLKTCVAGDNAELNKRLNDISIALHKVLTELENDTQSALQTAQTAVTSTSTRAVDLRTNATNAQTAADAARRDFNNLPPAQQQAQQAQDTLTAAQTNANTARERAEAAENEAKVATQALEKLIDLPEESRVKELLKKVIDLGVRQNTLRTQVADVMANGAPPEVQAELEEKVARWRTEWGTVSVQMPEARTNFLQAKQTRDTLQANTVEIVKNNQIKQLSGFLPGADGFNDRVLELTQRQFKEIVKLSPVNKHVDPIWLTHANHFKAQLEALQANDQAPISIPPEYEALAKPQDDVVNKVVGTQNIYDHAVRIVQNNGAGERSDHKEKLLALQVLGSFCNMQANVANKEDKFNLHEKSSIQMEAAARLLAASLTLKTAQDDGLKATLTAHAEIFEFKELHQTLDTLPGNPPAGDPAPYLQDLKSIFEHGVTLATVKTIEDNNTDLKLLLEESETDRTYENDVTVMNGTSRQKMFKESMLRTTEVLKIPNAAVATDNTVESRMWALSQSELDRSDATILGLLGLNGDRSQASNNILDQLVLASVALNDMSMNEDHVSRGSLINHINKYERSPTRETLKNHALHGFQSLSKQFTGIAIQIRSQVTARVNEVTTHLARNEVVTKQEIDQLVKQIIITTDAVAANSGHFNLKNLIGSAENLKQSDNRANRDAFKDALKGVLSAWNPQDLAGPLPPPTASQWITKDGRSAISRALKSTPIKSLPFINQVPVLGRCAAAAFNLSKGLFAATAGVAAGSVAVGAGAVAVAGLIGGAVVAAPLYGAYRAAQEIA